MKHTMHSFPRLKMVAISFGMLFALGVRMLAQEVQPAPQSITVGGVEITGLPDDWTHHHLMFSNPGSEEDAISKGTYTDWLRIVNDPRYIIQQLKRRSPAQGPAGDAVAQIEEMSLAQSTALREHFPTEPSEGAKVNVHRDWSMDLGSGATAGASTFPAKYSFSPIGAANCASATSPDYVIYNTSVAGSSTQASILAYDNLYSSCSGQVPSVYWAFNTGGTISTSVVLSLDGSQVAFIQAPSSGNAQLVLLKWAAKPTGRNVTGSVTANSTSFTVSSGTLTNMDVGAGISGTGIPAGDTIATVTSSTAGTLFTAATASQSGETLAITADAGGPHALTAVANSSYRSCTAPCMTTLSFSGTSRSDTNSPPFYDYSGSDALYVGDNSGYLHKFTGVFSGSPAEAGSPWPVAADSGYALTGPVYDANDGLIFMGDAGGYIESVNAGSGAVIKSVQVANNSSDTDPGTGIHPPPIVDTSAGQLYAYAASDLNVNNTGVSPCRPTSTQISCSGIINFPVGFTSTSKYVESVIGQYYTTGGLVPYTGAFDNLYWSNGTGNLYVNGINANPTTNQPKFVRTPISTSGLASNTCAQGPGSMANASAIYCFTNIVNPETNNASGTTSASSPVTETYDGTNDWVFLSVTTDAHVTVASGGSTCSAPATGCVYSFKTTSALASGANAANGLSATGGTSGIIIDNTVTGSQIYFSTLSNGACSTSGGTGGCAVQASQAALQ
jgi:hypothetical protein